MHTEVTVRRGLAVLRLLEVELLHNETRPEVEVVADDIYELLVGLLAGAVRVDKDGQRLGDTNSIRELHERTASKATRDERLGCKLSVSDFLRSSETNLPIQRAVYAAERSTFDQSLPEKAPPPWAPQPP